MKIPIVLFLEIRFLKRITPVIITKTGVRELSVPASALSIFSSAMQNKNAGIKLPRLPDKKTIDNFCSGILPMYLIVIGNNISPADKIRNEAIW